MAELTSPFDDHVLSLDYIKGDVEVEVKKIASAEMMTIQQTVDSIDYEILNKAADMILSSKNILFHGAGTSSIVCVDAMLRFLRIGLSVCSYNDIHFAIVPLSYYNDSDLVIGISHSGETKDTCNLMRMARAQNVKTIGITTYPSQEISKYCDLILKTITRESPNHKVAITSRTSQQIIIDALFIAVAIRSKQIPTNGLMNVSKNVNEYLY
jgi:DNA-binding MurR/RpiR family transcriptional regulator